MSRFTFICSEGRFPIPDGESRVGSDTSCAVCVHGEGILPVHAYLKVDGEKVLIRPFSEKAAIMVESAPVAGPQQIQHGERISLGPVQMRLASEHKRWRFPWRTCAYLAGGLASILLILVLLRFLWFNESWWKAQLLTSVEQATGRENASIEKLDLHFLDGRILVHHLTIANREPFPEDSNLLEVPEMELSIDVWQLLRSRFSEVRGGRVTMTQPLLKIERVERDGRAISNVDDLLSNVGHYASNGLHTLASLQAEVSVTGGRVEFKDRLAGAESALSDLTLQIKQDGFERKLEVALQARPETGGASTSDAFSSIGLDGDVRLFDATGRVDPGTIGDGMFTLKLKSFDLARLCQHARWEWRVRGGEQRIVPGKPVTGELRISFTDLERCDVSGRVESESLVSLLEPDRPPLGNIPTVVSVDRLTYDFRKGWPTDLEINLRADRTLAAASSHAEAKALVLRASLRHNATGEETFDIDLRSQLQDLCATDVGERLQLKGRLEGGLKASASFVRGADGESAGEGRGPQTHIQATIELDRSARVLVPSPLPAAEGLWQPLRLTANLDATAGSTPKGDITDVKGRIKAASDAFSIESTEDTELSSLDRIDQFSLKTFLKVNLHGKEFWNQYGPVLNLFGFDRPVEEEMSLDCMALSTIVPSGARAGTRQVRVGLDGKAARQWSPDAAPVPLYFILDYYPAAYAATLQRTPQPNAPAPDPYLVLRLQTGTEQQQPYAKVNAEVTRDGDQEIIRVPSLMIRSDMDAFEERFKPYLKWAGDFLGTDLLERYRVSGELGADGSLTVTRPVKRFAIGSQPYEAAFKFKVNGRNLRPSGPIFTPPASPEEKPRRWIWMEPAPVMTLEGRYRFRPAPNKEEPDVRTIDSLTAQIQGEVGAFSITATDLDLYLLDRLATRARVPGKSWPDATEALQVSGTVKPAAFDFIRRLELPGLKAWLTDPMVRGVLELNASFSRREDKAHLSKLIFRQDPQVPNAFWLKELNLIARLRGVRKLANEVFGRPRGTPLESVKLFDHLSEGLVVHKLVFDAPAFVQWLSAHPADEARENSFADFIPVALSSMLRTRTLDPQGPWVLSDLGLEGIANQEQAWRLYGHFHTDFMLTLPSECSFGRSSLTPVLMFKGPWTLPEKDTARLTLAPDGNYIYLSLHADLDATDLSLRNLFPAWVYLKDSGQPLQFNVDGLFPLSGKGDAQVYAFKTLALEGGPLDLRIEDGQARTAMSPQGRPVLESLSLASGTIKGGPLFADARVQGLSYNGADDTLIGRLSARRVDVPVLARVLPRFPGWSYEGLINELSLDVRGTLASLLTLTPDAARDRIRADLTCERVRISADAGHGEYVRMELDGQVGLSPTRIDGRALKLTLLHARKGDAAAPDALSKHVVRLPELLIATLQPEQSLRQALDIRPLPIQLNIPLQFDTAVDVDRLAEAWQTVRTVHYKGQVPAEEKKPTNRYEVLRALRADGTLSAPSFKLGPWTLDGLTLPQYSLRDLKLAIPLCAVKCAEGDLILTNAFYDLNHPEIVHSQKFELTKANLKALLGLGADDYRANGNLTIEGELQGIGLAPGSSWEGTADLHVRETSIEPPASFARAAEPPADGPFIDRLPALIRSAWQHLAGQGALSANDLSRDLPETKAAAWNTLFTATGLTLGGYGVTADRLDFEPARLQFIITHGIAELRPARLVGRDASLGLELSATGRVRLSDGTIDGELAIHPAQLPAAARETLALDEWPKADQERFLEDMRKGKLALRVSGEWKNARYTFPLAELRERVRQALPPPPPPPTPQPAPGKEPIKPRPLPEEDPSLPPERALLAIFDRLATKP